MSRVEVTCADALAWLMHCRRDSFDVIFGSAVCFELLARILPLAAERVRRWLHLYRVRSVADHPGWLAVGAQRTGRGGALRPAATRDGRILNPSLRVRKGSATIQTVNT